MRTTSGKACRSSVKLFVYMASGALAGIAGLLVVARNSFLLVVMMLQARLMAQHRGTQPHS